jgi:hypothetical protein
MKALKEAVKTLKANDDDTQIKLPSVLERVTALEKLLGNLRTQLQGVRDRVSLYPPNDKDTLEEIKARLTQLQDAINRLQTGSGRIAKYGPETGRVNLVNMHAEDLLFVVNDRTYRVAPGMSTLLELPAGAFTYEVISPSWGLRGRNTPVLRPGQTFTISAR